MQPGIAKSNIATSRQMLSEVAERYEYLVRPVIPDAPISCKVDEMRKENEGSDLLRIKFLPKTPRIPNGFWDTKWCSYSVAVGNHVKFPKDEGRGPFTWYIGFLHAPGNKVCSSGRYQLNVIEILRCAESKRPKDFFVIVPGDPRPARDCSSGDWSYINIFRRYYHSEFKELAAEKIAEDLCWLVSETYPKFKALGN